ncbi:hypothetical protein DPX16_17858 [Anabarilius grahami]|uniref:Uncharacterized protein n=1 Tax=Anabarilius grahami TaxID=495550 RepID=A0A3N0YGG7_ANAGA|nr:hypothetical protein DPX16_17858 [Anabarilius grahami]
MQYFKRVVRHTNCFKKVSHVSNLPIDVLNEVISRTVQQKHPNLDVVCLAKEVTLKGFTYRESTVIAHGECSGLPEFGEIVQMIVLQDKPLFIVRRHESVSMSGRRSAKLLVIVSQDDSRKLLLPDGIPESVDELIEKINAEFLRITTLPLQSRFMTSLDRQSSQLLQVIRSKGGVLREKTKDTIKVMDQSLDIDITGESLLKCLIMYLGEDASCLIKEYQPPELDRAHRSLAPKPAPGQRSRPVILRFHHFQVKDLVIRESRKKGELLYEGHKIRIFEDYWTQACTSARLRIALPNSEKKWLASVAEANNFIQSLDS